MKRRNIILLIISLLFACFCIIGNSFLLSDSFNVINNNILICIFAFILLTLLFFILLNKLFSIFEHGKIYNKEHISLYNNKIIKLFKKYPFIFSLIIILLLWLPYIISYYPAILSPDPSFQIRQYFGIPNKYSEYSILIDNSVIITNHHPVVHTLLLGSLVKIGVAIGNTNLGLFLYSIIQILLLSSTLAFTIKYLSKLNIPFRYLVICLSVYSLVPVFPFYSMTIQKDVFFGCFIILLNIFIFDYIKFNNTITLKKWLSAFLLMILIILFRNNGFYVLILSIPFLLFINNKNRGKILLLLISIICFNFCYNDIILPYFKITPTSVREALSIPFQQTARYVKEHNDQISSNDKKVIDKLLNYDTLAQRYNPELSDPVKNKFNRFYTKDDLKSYFKVWIKGLIKEPITYVEATINNTYGYFYPLKTNWYFYHKYDERLSDSGFDYHFNDLKISRIILSAYAYVFPYIPLVNIFVNIALNIWFIIIMTVYLIYKKYYKYITYLTPSMVLILICIASPANTYFRYALPIVFAMPLLVGLFLDINNNEK